MCLVIKGKKETKGRIAKWDIQVWKVLEKSYWRMGAMYTPYILFPVGDLPCEIVAEEKPNIQLQINCKYALYGGAIHAYADTRDGMLSLSKCFGDIGFDYWSRLVRAVIPAGARYWVGENGGVASERLRLVEVVASNYDWGDGLPTIREWCDGQIF